MNAPISGGGGPSQPERRIDELGREAFALAVTAATKAATQEVARIHRVRLVTQAAISSGLVALGIALVAAVLLYGAQLRQSSRNALYNCHLIQHVTLPLAQFVESDAELRARQARLNPAVQKGLARLFGLRILVAVERKSAHLNNETVHYWKTVVVPELQAVVGENCGLHVK